MFALLLLRSGSLAKLLRRSPFHNFLPWALRVTQGHRTGGISHRAACGWSQVHVDSGPVTLYLLQWPSQSFALRMFVPSWFCRAVCLPLCQKGVRLRYSVVVPRKVIFLSRLSCYVLGRPQNGAVVRRRVFSTDPACSLHLSNHAYLLRSTSSVSNPWLYATKDAVNVYCCEQISVVIQ